MYPIKFSELTLQYFFFTGCYSEPEKHSVFFLLLDTAGLSHIAKLNSAVSVHFCDNCLQGLSFYCKLKQKPMMICPKLLFSSGGPR